jgi:hypothetical protein
MLTPNPSPFKKEKRYLSLAYIPNLNNINVIFYLTFFLKLKNPTTKPHYSTQG